MGANFVSKFSSWPQYFDLDSKADMTQAVNTEIKGHFPKWIKGSLYRNGPGIYKMGGATFSHLFDGFGVIQRYTVKDGGVTYRTSVLDCESYKRSLKANRIVDDAFAASYPDPCRSIFSKFFSYFKAPPQTDSCSVNIVEHGDKLFTLTEPPFIFQVDGETMHSEKRIDIRDHLSVHMGTAHPHFDPEGNMYYYATNFGNKEKTYNIVKFPPPKEGQEPFSNGEIIASMPRRWKFHVGYTHSFGITENHIVHFEQPLTFKVLKFLTKNVTGGSPADFLADFNQEKINVIVFERQTGKVVPITYLAPNGFVFHFINCYEEGGQLVVDVALWEKCHGIRELYMDTILEGLKNRTDFLCKYARFVLPLNVEAAEPGQNLVTVPECDATAILRPGKDKVVDLTCDHIFTSPASPNIELPRINYDYNTKKHRYAYASSLWNSHGQVTKFDLQTKTYSTWESGDNHIPGEPVFLKDPAGIKEDDGVVLFPVMAKTKDHPSFLACVDTSTFKELGRAIIPVEHQMNLTFHGDFYKRTY